MNIHSKKALILSVCLVFVSGIFYYPKWNQSNTEATLSWDVSGYYLYLPAILIYQDIKQCKFKDSILNKYHPTPDFQQAFIHPSGNYIFKYTIGQAILYFPFFTLGHLSTLVFSIHPADGFSYLYQLSIGLGMLFYSFLGLFYLRKILLQYFSDNGTATSLIIIAFATNYFNYAAIDGAMTHNTLFTIYTILIYHVIKFYNCPSIKYSILIGLLLGLATLIRPTEIISLIIPLFWGIRNLNSFIGRIKYIIRTPTYFIYTLMTFLLITSVQLIYWKSVSGNWFVYTYGDEGFDWLQPHFINGLFSFKAGWLIYTPIMFFSIIGFLQLFLKYREHFYSVLFFSLLFTYVCFSWKEWWYGASLGQRSMIQSYPILAIPLTAFVDLAYKNYISKLFLQSIIIVCIYYNIWLTHHAHKGGLFKAGEMNKAYLFAIIGRNHISKEIESLLDNEEVYTGMRDNAITILENSETISLNRENQFSKELFFFIPKKYSWVSAKVEISTPQKEWETWKMPQFIIKFYNSGKVAKSNFIRVSRLLSDGEEKTIKIDAKVPKNNFDSASILFWNSGSEKQVVIKKLKVVAIY